MSQKTTDALPLYETQWCPGQVSMKMEDRTCGIRGHKVIVHNVRYWTCELCGWMDTPEDERRRYKREVEKFALTIGVDFAQARANRAKRRANSIK